MGQLHNHPFTIQFSAIQLVHGIVGISVIVKLHEAETVLEKDFADLAEAAEKPLQVTLPNSIAQMTDVDSRHRFSKPQITG